MRLILPLLFIALLTGCDSAETGLESGTFEAQISGGITKSLSGIASFGSTAGDEGIFTLALNTTAGDLISVARMVPSRPSTGTHTIVDIDNVESGNFWASIVLLQDDLVFQSTSGTLQITSSGPQRLSGTLTFDAVTAQGPVVQVSATFNAICGMVFTGGCD